MPRALAALAGKIVALAAVGALWLCLLQFPRTSSPELLDTSWVALLADDWMTRKQAGVDTVFTYGPLGYLLGPGYWYEPRAFAAKVAAELVAKLAIAGVLVWLGARLSRWSTRAAHLLLLLLLVPVIMDSAFLLAIVAAAVLVVERQPARLSHLAAGLALMACLAMVKFVLFVLAGVAVVAVACVLGTRRPLRAAIGVPALYGVLFATLWAAFGQSPLHLPAWLRGSYHIAAGYNESMAIIGPPAQVWVGAGVAVLLLGMGMVLAIARPYRSDRCALVAVAGAAAFAAWKTGFVRQDAGHTTVFFSVAAVLPFVLAPLARALQRGRRRLLLALGVVATSLSVHGFLATTADLEHRAEGCLASAWLQAKYNWLVLTHLPLYASYEDRALEDLARAHALPRVRAEVGSATIDEIGNAQALLLANALTIAHRPVFQSYSAYSPWLDALNGAFFARDGAPAYVLFKVAPIDGRLAMVEDSATYQAMLTHYRPILVAGDHLLLRRVAASGRAPAAQAAGSVLARAASLGEWVVLGEPGGRAHDVALDVRRSVLGEVRAFLFRSPHLYLDVRTDDGAVQRWRISPGLVRSPFLLDPLLRSTAEFGALYAGTPLPRVRALRVAVAPGKERWFDPRIGVVVRQRDDLLPAGDLPAHLRAELAALPR